LPSLHPLFPNMTGLFSPPRHSTQQLPANPVSSTSARPPTPLVPFPLFRQPFPFARPSRPAGGRPPRSRTHSTYPLQGNSPSRFLIKTGLEHPQQAYALFRLASSSLPDARQRSFARPFLGRIFAPPFPNFIPPPQPPLC